MTLKRISIFAGGTGGHVYPAYALATELLKRFHPIQVITDRRGLPYWEPLKDKLEVIVLPVGRLHPGFLGKMRLLFELTCGFFVSLKAVLKFKPDRAIGFGGFPTVPPLMVSVLLRIPFFLHEQNAVIGRVSMLFRGLSRMLFLSFPPPEPIANACVIGMPVRQEIADLADHTYAPSSDMFHLLILGGSQGASILGGVIPLAISLLPLEMRERLSVVHQLREADRAQVEDFYEKIGVKAKVSSFFADVPTLLRQSSLVIARAGASTVAEVATAGIPTLFVPFARAAQDHQTHNVQSFVDAGACWVMTEQDFNPARLALFLKDVLEHPEKLTEASKKMCHFGSSQAAFQLALKLLNV